MVRQGFYLVLSSSFKIIFFKKTNGCNGYLRTGNDLVVLVPVLKFWEPVKSVPVPIPVLKIKEPV